jgi:hypothetical protein
MSFLSACSFALGSRLPGRRRKAGSEGRRRSRSPELAVNPCKAGTGGEVALNKRGRGPRVLLRLGALLSVAHEPGGCRFLARADGCLPRRGARVQRRACLYPVGERARRIRVRELTDSVVAHALGELHRLLMVGGVRVAGVAALGRWVRTATPIRATMARAASGRSVLPMFPSACGDCVDTGSLPSVLVTAASLDRA